MRPKFMNIRAEAYWNARTWILGGGRLKWDNRLLQLAWIKYKISTDKVLHSEPKQDLKKRSSKSPDYTEAFVLTFTPRSRESAVRLL